MSKPVVRVHITDTWEGESFFSGLLSRLADEYEILRDSENPDFLFYSAVGTANHQQYDCVKIFFTAENVTPDFNWCDYAVGFDHLEYEDRYFRYPFWRLFHQHHPETHQPKDADFFIAEAGAKTGFCNFIYSNSKYADPVRVDFFERLSKYKHVDSGGKCRNNIGRLVEGVDGKLAWQRQYKFSIAFENSAKSGYTTEKLVHALAAHTIPIYWGDPRVCDDFNAKRFINYADYPSMDAVVERVRELDNDPRQYLEMLSQPWLADSAAFEKRREEKRREEKRREEKRREEKRREESSFPPHPLMDFVRHIFDQGPVAARRVPTHGWTLIVKERDKRYRRERELQKAAMRTSFFKRMRNSIYKRKMKLKNRLRVLLGKQ